MTQKLVVRHTSLTQRSRHLLHTRLQGLVPRWRLGRWQIKERKTAFSHYEACAVVGMVQKRKRSQNLRRKMLIVVKFGQWTEFQLVGKRRGDTM